MAKPARTKKPAAAPTKAAPRPAHPPAPRSAPARTAAEQAQAHRATRKAHAHEIAEDYAEAIADLIEAEGEARVVDLARRLGVSHVTVVRTVARLQREGLVSTRPYRSIFLTSQGESLAANSRRRHDVVVRFLRALGISEATAQADAEGIEHHVSDETLRAFERFAARPARRAP